MNLGKDFYKTVRIAAFVMYIPFVLVSAPVGGYLLGEYLSGHCIPNRYTTTVLALTGLLAGLLETFRVIRVVIKLGRAQDE
jgi:hypothetical protein